MRTTTRRRIVRPYCPASHKITRTPGCCPSRCYARGETGYIPIFRAMISFMISVVPPMMESDLMSPYIRATSYSAM
jgi:hypothetical protein